MASNVVPYRQQPTTLSLEQRCRSARSILAQPTTTTQALVAAKDLLGNFPNLRPDNPSRFTESCGRILEGYPLGLVHECIDPVCGIATKVEFLSLKSLTDWCNTRMEFYTSLARYQKPPERPQIEAGPISAEQCENLMAKVAEVLRANTAKSPLETMLDQVAKARRLRIEEIARHAYGDEA